MKEQPLFAPGDRVVCVNASNYKNQAPASSGYQLLVEGKTYTVQAVRRKKCCGAISVCVGLTSKSTLTHCKCGTDEKKKSPYAWHAQTRFVPVDFDKYAEETFHQSLKGKPVNA